jgi:hypothetical protein
VRTRADHDSRAANGSLSLNSAVFCSFLKLKVAHQAEITYARRLPAVIFGLGPSEVAKEALVMIRASILTDATAGASGHRL